MANRTRAQLSTDSSTNFPDNTSQLISPQDLRDWITNGIDSFVTQKDISSLENAIYENRGDAIVAGATTDLSLANGNFVHITGTTLITNFGTVQKGARFVLTFDNAANIKASSAIIIPGVTSGNTKTAVPNDCCMIISEGGGNWRIVGYFPAAGAGSGLVVDVTATTPLSSTGGTTPDISITQANGSTDGYLSSTDWNTFNDKVSSSGVPSAGEFAQFTTSNDITTATASSAKLLIGTPASSTIIQEISLGSGLSITGNTLDTTGGSGTVTGVTASSPLSSSGGTAPNITIQNAAADGTTKGAATFANSDFQASAGVINLKTLSPSPAGTYTNATVQVDATGRVTSASSGNVNLATQVTGTLPIANGGTGTTTPSLVAGSNVTISGSWPNQTINASGGGGGGTPGGSDTQIQYNNGGSFGGVNDLTWDDINNVLTANSPRIGQSTGNGHLHMHTINTSPPSGVTDYITVYADKSPKQIGARFETDAYTSAFQFGATADRVYTLPDATGNVLVDTVIPSLNNGTSAGEIRLKEATASGSNYVAVKSPTTLASDWSMTLPTDGGVSGQVLQTDGSGSLSWVNNGQGLTKQYISSTAATTYPANTAQGLFVSIMIPANTFTAGSLFKTMTRISKSGAGTSSALRMGFNSSNSLTGITWICASTTLGSGTTPGTNLRNFSVTSATATTVYNTSAAGWGSLVQTDIALNYNYQSINIDWTVDQYFIVSATTAPTDTFTSGFILVSPI